MIQNSSTGFYSNRQHIYAKHLGSVNSALQSHCHNGALERTHIRYHEQPYWPRWQFKDLPTLTYMSHISILVALSVAMYCTKCTLSARLRVTLSPTTCRIPATSTETVKCPELSTLELRSGKEKVAKS